MEQAANLIGIVSGINQLIQSVNNLTGTIDQKAPDYFTGVPSSSSSSGQAGQFSADASYLYVCIAANTWRRVALSSF